MVYLLALASALLWGAADFTGGITARRAGAVAVVLLSHLGALALLALMLPLFPGASLSSGGLLWSVAAGATSGIGAALLFHGLAVGTMSVVAPTTAICAVAIPVLASLLLGERPPPLTSAGIVLGVVAIALVSQQPGSVAGAGDGALAPRRSSGVGVALVAGVAIGVFFLSLARAASGAVILPLLVARVVSVALFGAIALARRRSLRMPARLAALVVGAGVLDMLATGLYMLAAREGPLSVAVTLSSLYPAGTVLLARVVLGERLSGWQIAGVGTALAAVLLIVRGA